VFHAMNVNVKARWLCVDYMYCVVPSRGPAPLRGPLRPSAPPPAGGPRPQAAPVAAPAAAPPRRQAASIL
jgi:hypothetical protein